MYNQRQIRLLDCTLRDGGHLVEGCFGREVIKNIIKKCTAAVSSPQTFLLHKKSRKHQSGLWQV